MIFLLPKSVMASKETKEFPESRSASHYVEIEVKVAVSRYVCVPKKYLTNASYKSYDNTVD